MRKLEESEEIENQDIGEHQQHVESQEEEEVEEDHKDKRMEKAWVILMSDVNDIPWCTSLDLEMFNNLVEQCLDLNSTVVCQYLCKLSSLCPPLALILSNT